MYNIVLKNVKKRYDYEELVKIFLPEDEFQIFALEQKTQGTFIDENELENICSQLDEPIVFTLAEDSKDGKNRLKGQIYDKLSDITGKKPPWGTLTGVRPVKLAGMLLNPYEALVKEYRVSEEKASEITGIYDYQQKKLGRPAEKSAGIYIGIPFCPTRCLYCSFTSNQASKDQIDLYLEALHKEISYVGRAMKDNDITAESIYIGGGTPTTLDEYQLDGLLSHIRREISSEALKEFTLEAGRPDTITAEKIKVMSSYGVDRISINPQTMKEDTLKLIGRNHTNKDIYRAFDSARRYGIPVINCDLIAGLPEESADDFRKTVNQVVDFGAENITVHSLAVKRASRLIDVDRNFHFRQAELVAQMIAEGKAILKDSGYVPYYLYRQKNMAGSLENTGYCKNDTYNVYNIRIMEEAQDIIAMGAGAISKAYYPLENRLERVANVSNYEIYISRIDEMIERKEKELFSRR